MTEKITKKMKRLEKIVSDLNGDLDLEDAVKTFETGVTLAGEIRERLADVEEKIRVLTEKNASGKHTAQEQTEGSE